MFKILFRVLSNHLLIYLDKNQKPTANGGGNRELALPQTVIYVNGSKSFDDWAITKWKWVRNEKSLAIGSIGEKSDESPVLILTDISPGIYIFNLTVYDEQGLSDTDVVSVNVKGDPMLYYLVDIILHCNVKHFTETQYTTLKGKLALLVKDGTKLQVGVFIVICFYLQVTVLGSRNETSCWCGNGTNYVLCGNSRRESSSCK